MMSRMKLKLNRDLNGFKAGHILQLSCDKDGIPLNPFWRRRLFDADVDNCVEVLPAEDEKASREIKHINKKGDQ